MNTKKRLEQLEQECRGRGVRLIYDDLRSEGGLCRLRGCYYLILNRRLASETKVRIIADALARVGDCPRMGTVPKTDSGSGISDRVPSPEPAAQPSPAATLPVFEEHPQPVYEEHPVGAPVAAGVPDNQS
jgi:hypothetical protein